MRPGAEKTRTRPAAVAGLFYPANPAELRDAVTQYLGNAAAESVGDFLRVAPKALIVPHAGYVYSGVVAGAAYAAIHAHRHAIRRVVLLGPSHRVYLHGVALPRADAFETPLGEVAVDRELRADLIGSGEVMSADSPHANEHSLEVQIPFLQVLLDRFEIVPLVAGTASPRHVAHVLAQVWGAADTLVIVSSDLSHYHPYEEAQRIDRETADAIVQMDTTLTPEQACGAVCINGLMHLCRERQYAVSQIRRMNSGDTAGDRARVVGYGAFAVLQ